MTSHEHPAPTPATELGKAVPQRSVAAPQVSSIGPGADLAVQRQESA
jgi:hypothetical protein